MAAKTISKSRCTATIQTASDPSSSKDHSLLKAPYDGNNVRESTLLFPLLLVVPKRLCQNNRGGVPSFFSFVPLSSIIYNSILLL